MSPVEGGGYAPGMGHYDYTPLSSPYPMSWPPKGCGFCGADTIIWAYPVGDVTFPRVVNEAGDVQEVAHVSQPWFACLRCKEFVDAERWDELAEALGKPAGHFARLRAAVRGVGYRYLHPRPAPRRR